LPKLEKTRIYRWNLQNYGTLRKGQPDAAQEIPEIVSGLVDLYDQSNLIVQRNSAIVFTKLSADLAAKGVIFTDLEKAAREHGDLVQKYLHNAVKSDENLLTSLHSALWSGGIFLYVPKNVEIEVRLQSIYLVDDSKTVFAPHVLI